MSSPFSMEKMKDQALQAAAVVSQIIVLNAHHIAHNFKNAKINNKSTRPQIKPRGFHLKVNNDRDYRKTQGFTQ